MKREEAEILKEKYYTATASPDEERRLAAFLRSEECPEEWADERRALLALLSLEAQALPEGFGARLTKRLEQERRKSRRAKVLRFARISVAAALLLVPLGWALRLVWLQPVEQPAVMAGSTKSAQPAPTPKPDAQQEQPKAEQQPAQTEKKAAPSLPKKKKRAHRPKKAVPAIVAPPLPAEKVLAEAKPAPEAPSPAPKTEKKKPETRTQSGSSLEAQLERTLRSRDRMMAEARAYMAGNCLDRRMPPLEPKTTEP